MFRVGFEALEVTVRVPLALPVDSGANTTLKVTLPPGVSVSGGFRPLKLNPGPVTVACEIVTDTPPTFVIVSDNVKLVMT